MLASATMSVQWVMSVRHRKIRIQTGLCSQCSRQTSLKNCASLRFIRCAPTQCLGLFVLDKPTQAVCHSHCHEQEAVFIEAPESITRWLRQILLCLLASLVLRPASRSGFSLSQLLSWPHTFLWFQQFRQPSCSEKEHITGSLYKLYSSDLHSVASRSLVRTVNK
jgi:hypothetical protein